jgi:hypothetical protein
MAINYKTDQKPEQVGTKNRFAATKYRPLRDPDLKNTEKQAQR